MTQPHYSVKQQDHHKFICCGLSSLQQNSDLVDMTIAADGHYVKVHKIIMSLASPYFKDLIASTAGHPVVYLNKVSFATLSSILEYIYMGESRIQDDKLDEFIQVSNDLKITGLKDLIPQSDLRKPYNLETNSFEDTDESAKVIPKKPLPIANVTINPPDICDIVTIDVECATEGNKMETSTSHGIEEGPVAEIDHSQIPQDKAKVQFTISNQGTLQAIFNRYIYNQKYVYKRGKESQRLRQWRCMHSRQPTKCPASLITDQDKIVKRLHAHNHSFHDQHILKKLKKNAIFAAISEAETHVTSTPKSCRLDDSDN